MNSPKLPSLEPAEIDWQDGVPESRAFGDVYFNRGNGLAETRYIFITHNRLNERFANLGNRSSFVIGESGFGTGLSFLAAWQAFRAHCPAPGARLHFVSVERYPLSRQDLQRALSLWPELAELSDQLVAHYPPLITGVHRILLDHGRVRLTLYLGDVTDGWRELDFQADAWFLDGFAPAINPEMWLEDTMHLVRQHSKPGATLATFTSVGSVRRALTACGFKMTKTAGFGRKREMLHGELADRPAIAASSLATPPRSVAIIGAGIAGCLLAANLASRGVSVTLIDRASGPGAAASGNLQGALYVKLGVEFNAQTQLALSALLFSQRYYEPFRGDGWHPTGLFQMAFGPQEHERQQRFTLRNDYPPEVVQPVSAERASELCGLNVADGGLWFAHSGWLQPALLCQHLSQHPGIQHLFSSEVSHLERNDDGWRVLAGDQIQQADRVVICGGHETPALIPLDPQQGMFRLKPIRGQVSHLPASIINSPGAVICGPRYINPASNGVAVTGATFDLHDLSPAESAASHRENVAELTAMLPGIWQHEPMDGGQLAGRVGFRCTTHDYQPVAGELSGIADIDLEHLFLLTGFGSKGLTYSPLLAEYLADVITGEPRCLPSSLVRRVEPGRCFRPVPADQAN
jgi:tRNA 5-methylaminomethyl-2-thiouridine biosynthesis bifunctional protein